MALHTVSVCSGIAGLDLGVTAALNCLGCDDPQPLLYVEREAYCAAQLVNLFGQKSLAEAPIWSDVTTITGPEISGFLDAGPSIDLLFGGVPCQPWSQAGKRQGKGDERDLWPHVREFVAQRSPSAVFLENVPGFAVFDGLGRVASDLQGLGYKVASIVLSATDVGASHGRERLFILANRDGENWGANRRQPNPQTNNGHEFGGNGSKLAYAGCRGDNERQSESIRGCGQASSVSKSGLLVDRAESQQRGSGRQQCRVNGIAEHPKTQLSGIPIFAPGPTDQRWADILTRCPHLSPAVEPELRRMVDGLAHRLDERTHRNRACGNGVVPLQAAVAFVALHLALHGGPVTLASVSAA